MRRVHPTRTKKLFAELLPIIYWSVDLGTPVFVKDTEKYGRLKKIKLVPPGDVRPAFTRDVENLYIMIKEQYSKPYAERLFSKNPLVLLNRVQAIDMADEVVVSGYSIGIREYDIAGRKWLFKPMYYGVRLYIEEELGPYIKARKTIKPNEYLYPGDYRGRPPVNSRWVPIKGKNKWVYGLGKKAGRRILVVKQWRISGKLGFNPKKATLQDAARHNREYLEEKACEATAFLEETIGLGLGYPIVSLSGGKDSGVTAYLAGKAGVTEAVFVDTGLELPETIETAIKTAEKAGLQLTILRAHDRFWRALRIYGPPARDYRWCCKVVKLSLLGKHYREKYGRVLAIVGQRRYESPQRALADRLSPSGTVGEGYVAAPIHEWISLEVFLYSILEKIPLNPLYMKGYDRIGCYLCPTSRMAELELIKETHPEHMIKWMRYLENYAEEHGLPRQWIDLGLWRWRFRLPGEIKMLSKRQGIDIDAMNRGIAEDYVEKIVVDRDEDLVEIHFKRQIPLQKIYSMIKIIGLNAAIKNNGDLRIHRKGREVAEIKDNYLRTRLSWINDKHTRELLMLVYMKLYCVGCGMCSIACPRDTIGPDFFEPSRCNGCRKCLYSCPSANNLVGHVFTLLGSNCDR